MADSFTFVIDGRCPTKGSTRSFVNPKVGKVVTIADNARLKQWTKDAKWQARAAGVPMVYKPHGVMVNVLVEFVKPKTSKATAPTVRPDADKLLRAILDALTGLAYADDAQVVHAAIMKAYGPSERVTVTVARATVIGSEDHSAMRSERLKIRSAAQEKNSTVPNALTPREPR